MTIYQGDQYLIPLVVKRNGVVQTSADIEVLEVILAGNRKTYTGEGSEIIYSSSDTQFLYPLYQEESFALDADTYDALGRAHYKDHTISGWQKLGSITVIEMEGAETI